MKVLFAPDWRGGVPYQRLLAAALERRGVTVQFLQGYKRGFPLARSVPTYGADIFHLHWPEAYFPARKDACDLLRAFRFPLDLALATRKLPLVLTAHNLYAHNRGESALIRRNAVKAYGAASAIFAHSDAARDALVSQLGVKPERCTVIPHGDLSSEMAEPVDRPTARRALGLSEDAKVALMFGTIEPYKGIEELVTWWKSYADLAAVLVIAGKPDSDSYRDAITAFVAGDARIRLHAEWLADDVLRDWLSAADSAVFNYRSLFTSGAVPLARSLGLPVLLPARLRTVDAGEPSPRVFRFDGREEFRSQLEEALKLGGADFSSARDWRSATAWDGIAGTTLAVYESVLKTSC